MANIMVKPNVLTLALVALLCCVQVSALGDDLAACYLPTQSNVSYSQLIDLPTSSPNEIIAYGQQALQLGELWLPSVSGTQATQHPPLLIFIHGGCWLNEYDIEHSHALSTALAQAGYAVWSLEYRRTGDAGGGWPGSLQDIEQGIAYVSQLKDFAVNLSQIVIVGHSAGGHLALLAGANSALVNELGVDAVIGLAPIVDLAEYSKGSNSCQTAVRKFMGGSLLQRPAQYVAANPISFTLHPNTILIHGSADSIVPLAQSKNRVVDFQTVEAAGHFDMIHPGTVAFQVLLQQLARVFK